MYVAVPGAHLYVERAGSGLPLLNISGSGSALSDGFAPKDLPMSKAFDVVGYDHRGLGASESELEAPTMADFAADALALADALGWDRFALVGTSFGGMVAQHVAVTAPERITRLVLACTSSGGAGGSSYPLHERPGPETQVSIFDTRPEVQEMVRQLMEMRRAGEPKEPGFTRQLDARRVHDVYDRLPLITAPTLVAAGRFDGIAPLVNSEAIAAQIPHAELQVFDGGHGFFLQDPTAWPAIMSFLTAA